MSQSCKICNHPDRKFIDTQLASGLSMSEISRKHGISYDSLWRHKESHVGPGLARAAQKSLQNHEDNLLMRIVDKLDKLTVRTEGLLDKAEASGKVRDTFLGVQQLRNTYETAIKLWTTISQQQGQQRLITIEQQEGNSWLSSGFKKLSKADQEAFADITFKLYELSGGSFEEEAEYVEEEQPVPPSIEADEELRVAPEDFSLRPVKIPKKKVTGMTRTRPRKG